MRMRRLEVKMQLNCWVIALLFMLPHDWGFAEAHSRERSPQIKRRALVSDALRRNDNQPPPKAPGMYPDSLRMFRRIAGARIT